MSLYRNIFRESTSRHSELFQFAKCLSLHYKCHVVSVHICKGVEGTTYKLNKAEARTRPCGKPFLLVSGSCFTISVWFLKMFLISSASLVHGIVCEISCINSSLKPFSVWDVPYLFNWNNLRIAITLARFHMAGMDLVVPILL